MKNTILLTLFILTTSSNLKAQTIHKPIWTTHHVGKSAVYSSDNSKILTWGGGGASLWNAENGQHQFTLSGHQRKIVGAKFSKNGKKILTYGNSGEIIVWSVETGEKEFRYALDAGDFSVGIVNAEFDNNNENILFLDDKNTVSVINIKTGLPVYENRFTWIIGIQLSPGGVSFLGKSNYSFGEYEFSTGELVKEIKSKNGQFMSASFDKTGKYVLTTSEDDTVRIWDFATGKSIGSYFHGEGLTSAQYSADGSKILSFSDFNLLKIWNVADGRLLFSLYSSSNIIRNAFISPLGNRVVSLNNSDSSAVVWDINSSDSLHVFKESRVPIKEVIFSSLQDRILLTCEDGTTKVYDVNDNFKELFTLHGHNGVGRAEFHPKDHNVILTSDVFGVANVWSLSSGALITTIPLHLMQAHRLGPYFSKNGDFLVFLPSKYRKPVLWNIYENRVEKVYNYTIDSPFWGEDLSLSISPDNEAIACGANNVGVYSMKTGDTINVFPDRYLINQFNKSGTQLLCQTLNFQPRLLNIQSGNVLILSNARTFDLEFRAEGKYVIGSAGDYDSREVYGRIWESSSGDLVNETMFDVDDQFVRFNTRMTLALTGYEKVVKVWDVWTGAKIKELKSQSTNYFRKAVFLDDTRYVATNKFKEGDVEVWDTKSGKVVHRLIGHAGNITQFVIHPDGNTLLTSSEDGTAKLWDISSIIVSAEEDENNQEPIITLSPNPTTGNVTVSASSTSEKRYSIINQFGEKVLAGLLPESVNPHTIETSVLPSGMYLFVYDINGKTFQEKFIVNR